MKRSADEMIIGNKLLLTGALVLTFLAGFLGTELVFWILLGSA